MSDLTLVIANKAYSSWSLRPWLAMTHAGLPFDEIIIPLRQADTSARILAHSPAGKVPVLRHGAITVWESLAILDHLAETFPQTRLWPSRPAARAMARSVAAEMHAGFAALRRALPMDLKQDHPAPPLGPEVLADIARVTALWTDARARFGSDGPFLFGAFSAADAMYAPVCTRFRTYAVDLDPVSAAYVETILALPAMVAWTEAARQEPWIITF